MAKMRRITLIFLAIVAFEGPAIAAEIDCGLTQTDVIVVDGMLDDWQGVKGVKRSGAAGSSSRDAVLVVRCNYDAETLYLAIDVTDERVIRRDKREKLAEDKVVVTFGDRSLEVYPADAASRQAQKASWSDGAAPKGLAIADSLQERGWSVELGLPLGRVPGWGRGVPGLEFSVEHHDADLLTEREHQEVVSTGDGLLVFEEAAALYQQFLTEHKLKPSDIVLDTMANMDAAPGAERVLVGGRVIGVLGAEYSYLKLPIAKAKDLLSVKVIDLAGEGKSCILAHYVERGNGGLREVLAVWNVMADGSFARTWAHEIAKQLGQSRLTNTFSLEAKQPAAPAGKKKKKPKKPKKPLPGFDIVVRVGDVTGFTAETWNELPAEDMVPILLPWGPKQQETWHFQGDESFGGE